MFSGMTKLDEEFEKVLKEMELKREKEEANDFEGLDDLKLKEVVVEIKKTRILARDIIKSLEPRYVIGLNHLKEILNDALNKVDTEIQLNKMKKGGKK